MKIISLFSGIGLFDLGVLAGLEEAGHEARIAAQVELDPFCRALARHYPDSDRSVTDVRSAGALSLPRVDLIIGGFPCQDVSGAGRGEGLSGARSGLWWEFRRIVGELLPELVLVENVLSGLAHYLGPVRCSLESLGYRTAATIVRASDCGAPHARGRVFILAYTDRSAERLEPGRRSGSHGPGQASALWRGEGVAHPNRDRREGERGGGILDGQRAARGHDADRRGGTSDMGLAIGGGRVERAGARCDGRGLAEPTDAGQLGDALRSRREGPNDGAPNGLPRQRGADARGAEPEAERRLGGAAHGRAEGLDGHRWPAPPGPQHDHEAPRTITGTQPNRRARLKALGNAVTPQQALAATRWALITIEAWARGGTA